MQDLEPGDRAGPYRIDHKLKAGHGGMAVVYRASLRTKYAHTHSDWPTLFAVKVSVPEYTDFLKRESDFLANLDHPHIVKVFPASVLEQRKVFWNYEQFRNGRNPYFVMEYLNGGTLEELLARKKRLGIGQTVIIARQFVSALEYIHQRGIIHLDIKPKNIMFRRQRRWWAKERLQPVLGDFGLARGLGYPPPLMRAVTPEFMSPEQFQEASNPNYQVDHRSDIFSAGIVLYQMITGHLPFENPADLLLNPPLSPSALNRQVPPQLEAIILRCLAKEPVQRYADTSHLAQELAAIPLPVEWGQAALYAGVSLALVGGAWVGAQLWPVASSLFEVASTATPTLTVTLSPTDTATAAPNPTDTATSTVAPTSTLAATGASAQATLPPEVVTSTPLPTSTPIPPPTSTPTPTSTATTAAESAPAEEISE